MFWPSIDQYKARLSLLIWLTGTEKQQVKSLLMRYQDSFSAHEEDLGCTKFMSHEIPLTDDIPVRQRYRWLPPSEYDVVKSHINQLLKVQVIRKSCSPYDSLLFWSGRRMVALACAWTTDNAKTRKDAFSLPRICFWMHCQGPACFQTWTWRAKTIKSQCWRRTSQKLPFVLSLGFLSTIACPLGYVKLWALFNSSCKGSTR